MSINKNLDTDRLADASSQSMYSYWILFVLEGLVLVSLGCLAIVIPSISSVAVTQWLGWLFFGSGIVGLMTTLLARTALGLFWSLISAGLALIVGAALIGKTHYERAGISGNRLGQPDNVK